MTYASLQSLQWNSKSLFFNLNFLIGDFSAENSHSLFNISMGSCTTRCNGLFIMKMFFPEELWFTSWNVFFGRLQQIKKTVLSADIIKKMYKYFSKNFPDKYFTYYFLNLKNLLFIHKMQRNNFSDTDFCLLHTVGWGTKAQCFRPLYLKTWFFYVLFNAELNDTIRILCFRHAIIDPAGSIMSWRKHKILMVPFNSALKTT